MKLSEREKSIEVQKHELLVFNIDQEVRLKKEFESVNGGESISGVVKSIKIDRNGIWYAVLYSVGEDIMDYRSVYLLGVFLEGKG